MIAQLTGTVAAKDASSAIIECGGVGYEVLCTLSALEALPPIGQTGKLAIHTHVREDIFCLYGFADFDERTLFKQVIAVSGIGPKTGLAIVSTFSVDELHTFIAEENVSAISRVPGIGPKTAKRLVLELKDRLKVSSLVGAPLAGGAAVGIWQDLESGLLNLGYKADLIAKTVDKLRKEHGEAQDLTLLLKAALKLLAKR